MKNFHAQKTFTWEDFQKLSQLVTPDNEQMTPQDKNNGIDE